MLKHIAVLWLVVGIAHSYIHVQTFGWANPYIWETWEQGSALYKTTYILMQGSMFILLLNFNTIRRWIFKD